MEKSIGIQQHMGHTPKKYSNRRKDTAIEEKRQKTRQKLVIYVEYSGCDYKSTKTEVNQRQGFISREWLRNIWCKSYLKAQKQRNNEEESRVECTKCERKDIVIREKIYQEKQKKILCSEYRTKKKKLWQNWREVAQPVEAKVQQGSI